ncbi:RING-H2 finger protein ATL74 [Sorghum bicolor]|uniref:RING-H2 finger protein ATL74 n=1 Tax=Sorghum bicolor TaxID=4558 RepID=UPI000B4248DD|nr:RING-H2 finger protein ATL74 [Sorghum bicolor]|eukprot:XP_002442771.2 RING-H2 finger protein ATL74 [Sorghum bicolor]
MEGSAVLPHGRPRRRRAHTGIILAAVLCVLVGVLSLHPLLRCELHYCGRRSSALGLGGADPHPPAGGAGLKKSVLRKMPVAVYGAECAICLGEFADGDAVRLLPRCRHGFHVHCIDTWLSAHSSCPICRDSLLDDEGAMPVPLPPPARRRRRGCLLRSLLAC